MTTPEKKKRIEDYFDEARKCAIQHRMEAFYIYLGAITGILETIDTCGKETIAFREKTRERVSDLVTYYKKGN